MKTRPRLEKLSGERGWFERGCGIRGEERRGREKRENQRIEKSKFKDQPVKTYKSFTSSWLFHFYPREKNGDCIRISGFISGRQPSKIEICMWIPFDFLKNKPASFLWLTFSTWPWPLNFHPLKIIPLNPPSQKLNKTLKTIKRKFNLKGKEASRKPKNKEHVHPRPRGRTPGAAGEVEVGYCPLVWDSWMPPGFTSILLTHCCRKIKFILFALILSRRFSFLLPNLSMPVI